VERTLGMLKCRFPILRSSKTFDSTTQAKLFNALCCLHNFIRFNGRSIQQRKPSVPPDIQKLQIHAAEREAALPELSGRQQKLSGDQMRDQIAKEMWNEYQRIMRGRRF